MYRNPGMSLLLPLFRADRSRGCSSQEDEGALDRDIHIPGRVHTQPRAGAAMGRYSKLVQATEGKKNAALRKLLSVSGRTIAPNQRRLCCRCPHYDEPRRKRSFLCDSPAAEGRRHRRRKDSSQSKDQSPTTRPIQANFL